MNKIAIFTTQRRDAESVIPSSPVFVPIAGIDHLAKRERPLVLSSTGDSIWRERSSYCELESQYWAWKNYHADYYGFCHYRRYFSFSERRLPEDIHGAVNYDYFDEACMEEMGLDTETIEKRVNGYDFLIAAPANVKKVGFTSLYEQYGKSEFLDIADLRRVAQIIQELYPEYADSAEEYLNGTLLYPCNMFIMRRELFFEYSKWLFDILQEFERRTDLSKLSVDELRVTGHVGERLLGVFYTHVKKNRPECRTDVLQRSIIWHPDAPLLPRPYFEEENVPVVLAFSDSFVPYAGVTIHSILTHINERSNYDLLILHTGIEEKSQTQLRRLCAGRGNVAMRFVDISSYVEGLTLIENNHVSVETFYRLLCTKVLKHYEKVVYLDSDLIVLRDLKELFDVELGTLLLGAAVDPDHAGEYNGGIPGVKEYTDRVLNLKDPFSYFQAGVLLLNIREMRKQFGEKMLLETAAKREYMYVDQDVLNMCCEGRTRLLDMKWNVMVDCLGIRKEKLIRRAPADIYYDYLEARKQPYIIHYAGVEKPWTTPDSDFAEVFWKYARETLFYEVILQRMGGREEPKKRSGLLSKNGRLFKLANRLLPKGTRRREIVKKIARRFLQWS